MIRFLNLQDQIVDGGDDFAFYDTITDRIVRLNGEDAWDRLEDFTPDYAHHYRGGESPTQPLERFANKILKDYFRGLNNHEG